MRQVVASIDVETATPDREVTRWGWIVFGFAAAPSVWLFQLIVDYGLASYACFPNVMPRQQVIDGFGWVWGVLVAMNLAGLAVSLVASAVAYRNLRSSWADPAGGPIGTTLDAGDRRNSFLSIFGLWSGVWFLVAIAFDTIVVFWVPLCGR